MAEADFESVARPQLSKAEVLLSLMGVFLLGLFAYLYGTNISLRDYFFPELKHQGDTQPVGTLNHVDGKAFRMRVSDAEFTPIYDGAALFADDTIMTGPDSKMALELKDGEKFQVAQNTLVKLAFQLDFMASGIIQRTIVSTVSGIRTTPIPVERPRPRPPALVVSRLNPPPHSVLTVSAEEYSALDKTVPLSFKVNLDSPPPVAIHVFKGKSSPENELTVLDPAGSNTLGASLSLKGALLRPGHFTWEVWDALGKVLGKSDFLIDPKVAMIELNKVEQNNNRLSGLAAKNRFDGFTLSWKSVTGASPYKVSVFNDRTKRLLLNSKATSTKLILNQNKLILGKMYFTVEKDILYGFTAVSKRGETFGFTFLPPELTSPKNNVFFSKATLDSIQSIIIFTWTKTNYTERYEIQVATDPEFQNLLYSREVVDNFSSLGAPESGKYYWRVRSISGETTSPFSTPRTLTIGN